MSFSDILNRFAEKKALQGDSDFAFRLISASEKEEEKEEKEAEMIKRGKDRKKVASKEVWIEAYEELLMRLIPKFMERGLGEDEAEFAAEQNLEKHSHLVDARAGDLEGMAIDRAMMMHGDTYASTLSNMIKKYAGKDRKKVAFSDESWLDSWLEARENLYMVLIPKFMESGLGKDEAGIAAEQYLEEHPNLVNEKAAILEERDSDRAVMMGGDAYASTLSNMIKKYAGESEKGSYEDAIKNLPGFTGMFGNGFCFMNKAQAQKALAIGEQAANFLDWAVEKHDDGFMAISRGRDKKSSTLDSMIKKYAGEDKEDKKKTSQELEIERYNRERDKWDRMKKRWDKFKSENPLHKKSSTLVSMIKKYAKEDWEITGEEFYGGETPDLDFEDDNQFYDAMGRGFEDAKYTPESQSNPYSGNEELSAAYEAGVRHALEMLQQRGTKL